MLISARELVASQGSGRPKIFQLPAKNLKEADVLAQVWRHTCALKSRCGPKLLKMPYEIPANPVEASQERGT